MQKLNEINFENILHKKKLQNEFKFDADENVNWLLNLAFILQFRFCY